MVTRAYIKISRLKLAILLILGIGAVTGGGFLVAAFEISADGIFKSIVGVICILFFGIAVVFSLFKLFDSKPGFVFHDLGFIDNSSGIAAGEVLWEDIATLRTNTVSGQGFISIFVRNPEMYIDRQTNFLKRKAMALNLRWFGSPIAISANGLDISFKDLVNEIETRYRQYLNT